MTLEEFIERIDEIMCGTSNAERAYLEDLYDEATKPHWISVADELPKIGKDVLVLREDGEMQVAHQYNEEIARWWSVDGFPLKNNITHWMPLPSIEGIKKGGEE